jgi:hypothetical protein
MRIFQLPYFVQKLALLKLPRPPLTDTVKKTIARIVIAGLLVITIGLAITRPPGAFYPTVDIEATDLQPQHNTLTLSFHFQSTDPTLAVRVDVVALSLLPSHSLNLWPAADLVI